MMTQLPDSRPPLVLIFGVFDPSGAQSLPADAVTCAALNAHALGVLTGTSITDSSGLHQIDDIIADQIDEQARTLLEDMPISAFKVGSVLSPEAASTIAQIVADYDEAPMVLHLGETFNPNPSSTDPDQDDLMVGATLEMLVPQAQVVVVDHARLPVWFNEDVVEHLEGNTEPQALLTLGADWALILNHPQRPGHLVHLLLGPDAQTHSWAANPRMTRVQDLSGLVATALAVGLGKGLTPLQASELACQYGHQAIAQAFQAGMGDRIAKRFPDHKPCALPETVAAVDVMNKP